MAQEHGRQRRRRHPRRARRRRRPEPQLPHELGPRQRGLVNDPTSETYRGTAPDSEPETKAMRPLGPVDFAFQKNDHTAAELLLYPQGFQLYTPTPDNAIFTALAGDDASRRSPTRRSTRTTRSGEIEEARSTRTRGNRFDPDICAELYITNGDTLDDALPRARHPRLHARGHRPLDANASRLRVPGRRGEIQAEFERHRFRARPRRVGGRPGAPGVAHGQRRRGVLRRQFADSYGDPQRSRHGQALARRRSAALPHQRRQRADRRRQEAPGGERYNNDAGRLLPPRPRQVKGTSPATASRCGSRRRAGKRSAHFTYAARRRPARHGADPRGRELHRPAPTQDPSGPST